MDALEISIDILINVCSNNLDKSLKIVKGLVILSEKKNYLKVTFKLCLKLLFFMLCITPTFASYVKRNRFLKLIN